MAMPLAPGAAVPAGAGDLAVAAAFAAGADSEIGEPRGDRSDSSSVSSSDDERGDDGDEPVAEPSRGRPTADGPAPEFEFSDEETRRAIPGVIRDGSDSSEWSDSSDDEDVEELDLANMPKWLEDIKNNVKTDFDDDAAHAEPPRTKNEIAADAVPPPPPPPIGPDEALVAVGDVISVVGDVVVVQSLPGIEPMDEESVLCLETRKGLGAIEEVFGPVAAPLYAMRMPAARQTGDVVEKNGDDAKDDDAKDDRDDRDRYVSSLDVKVGTRVFAVEGRRRALDTRGLRTKGYDNSGQNDEEVAEDEEFSDDEREAEAKKKRKQKKRGAEGDARGGAVRDGGLAAAAAAAGGGAAPEFRGGGRGGRGDRGGGYAGAGGRGFQPAHPPAMQMAYMNVGVPGGFQAPPQMVPRGPIPAVAGGGAFLPPGHPSARPAAPAQMMHPQQMLYQPQMMHQAPGVAMTPPPGFVPQPPPANWPPGQPWPPQPPRS
jgi:H/ACA ribonucleoprotein complex non-core subunit NAF1